VTAVRTCVDCGAADAHVCRLCDSCIVARTRAEAAAQGLPPTVTDPAVLDRIAVIVAPTDTKQGAA
jgi:hypothetical protein